MMPAPFNKLCRGLDRSPGNQMSLDHGDTAGYDSNSWPSGFDHIVDDNGRALYP